MKRRDLFISAFAPGRAGGSLPNATRKLTDSPLQLDEQRPTMRSGQRRLIRWNGVAFTGVRSGRKWAHLPLLQAACRRRISRCFRASSCGCPAGLLESFVPQKFPETPRTVDNSEDIYTVVARPIENQNPFEAGNTEQPKSFQIGMADSRVPAHLRLGRKQSECIVSSLRNRSPSPEPDLVA